MTSPVIPTFAQCDTRCHALKIYQQFFLSLVHLVISSMFQFIVIVQLIMTVRFIRIMSVLFILRLYAIYGKDRRILGFLSLVATGVVGNGLVSFDLFIVRPL